jgi:hypothetical protein
VELVEGVREALGLWEVFLTISSISARLTFQGVKKEKKARNLLDTPVTFPTSSWQWMSSLTAQMHVKDTNSKLSALKDEYSYE